MNEILQANIFFFIASVATVVFLILISVILYHVIKIVRSIRSIVEKIEVGSEVLADDVSNLRSQIINGGGFITRFITLFINSGVIGGQERSKRKSSSQTKRAKVKEVDEE
jgi:hypothetical protein